MASFRRGGSQEVVKAAPAVLMKFRRPRDLWGISIDSESLDATGTKVVISPAVLQAT